MEYTGLIRKYPINRPLTEKDRAQQLHQKTRLEVAPAYQLSVIRMNSTFIELVDKFYAWKGFLTTVLLIFIGMITFFSLFMVFEAVFFGWKNTEPEEYLLVFFVLTIFAAPFIWVGIWLLRKESFAFMSLRTNSQSRGKL